jgi:hypothetical protein
VGAAHFRQDSLTGAHARPILDSVGGVRHLGLMAIAGVLLSLPAAADPATHIYATHVPAASRVEARVAHTADWDVSVTFDAETCEVYCEYRPKAHGFHLFLPPVTELRIYSDGGATPLLVIVDPAGVRVPVAAAREVFAPDLLCIEGKVLAGNSLATASAGPTAPPTAPRNAATGTAGRAIGLPLRI